MLLLWIGRTVRVTFFVCFPSPTPQTVYENTRYAVTETCLALAVFREDIDVSVVLLFGTLLFVKIFHWLAELRVDAVSLCGDEQLPL